MKEENIMKNFMHLPEVFFIWISFLFDMRSGLIFLVKPCLSFGPKSFFFVRVLFRTGKGLFFLDSNRNGSMLSLVFEKFIL
jgi:hypothetical protein